MGMLGWGAARVLRGSDGGYSRESDAGADGGAMGC